MTAVVAVAFLVWANPIRGDALSMVVAVPAPWVARAWRGKLREGWAFIGSALTIGLAVVSLFLALFPDVMPSTTDPAFSLTTTNAASTPYTLTIMTVVAVIFVPLVLIYQVWTYYVFRKRVTVPRSKRRRRPSRPDHVAASPRPSVSPTRRLIGAARVARGSLVAAVILGVAAALLAVLQAAAAASIAGAVSDGLGLADLARSWPPCGRPGRAPSLAGRRTSRPSASAARSRRTCEPACSSGPCCSALAGRRTRRSASLVLLATRGLDALDGWFGRYLPQVALAVVVPRGRRRLLGIDPFPPSRSRSPCR